MTEQKKDISGKTGNIQTRAISLDKSAIPMLISWFRSLYHGYVHC